MVVKKSGSKVTNTLSKKRQHKLYETPRFARRYLVFCVLVLLLTVIFWSLLGARIHQNNADQLVHPYLFENLHTLHSAIFPGQHTFLLKWPLFWLIKLFHFSPASFIIMTILLNVVTTAGLVWLLFKVESRPLVRGTLVLALASVLLLVPNQPYPGAILPVNMAMLTTRNIEYLIYIGALVLIARSHRAALKSKQWWLAVLLLGILIASDRLFLTMTLAGSLGALGMFILSRNRSALNQSIRWLSASLLAGGLGIGLVLAFTHSGLGLVEHANVAGPYPLIHRMHDLVLGLYYGASGFLTNFGANPVYDALGIKELPARAAAHLWQGGGIAYIINLNIFGGAVAAAVLIGWKAFRRPPNAQPLDEHSTTVVMLLWSSIAALVLFLATKHYYSVDARYLTIGFFGLFAALALWANTWKLITSQWLLIGAVLFVSILSGVAGALNNYRHEQRALQVTVQRNRNIADAIQQRPVDYLVGDYWRVLPVKLYALKSVNVYPLDGCTHPRDVLSSKAWQTDLHKHSFAYIFTTDSSLTGYQPCSLDEIVKVYGRPNNSVLIDGSVSHPKELLLIYDHGINTTAQSVVKTKAQLQPSNLDIQPSQDCSGTTILQIVAHQDDDLLFMNPDLFKALQAGYCVRTIYVTAGDAGNTDYYWLGREKGSETAYDTMDGPNKDLWIHKNFQLKGGQYVTISHPQGNPKISLIFMRLPDGSPSGGGYKVTSYESLSKLEKRSIPLIHSVDRQSQYTHEDLRQAIEELLAVYQPEEIRTQADVTGKIYIDHSDHMAVSRLVTQAKQSYTHDHPSVVTMYYLGYPVHSLPANVSETDLPQKLNAFLAYSSSDKNTCVSLEACERSSVYGIYLKRQYKGLIANDIKL